MNVTALTWFAVRLVQEVLLFIDSALDTILYYIAKRKVSMVTCEDLLNFGVDSMKSRIVRRIL